VNNNSVPSVWPSRGAWLGVLHLTNGPQMVT
jgi:hypothetical protein